MNQELSQRSAWCWNYSASSGEHLYITLFRIYDIHMAPEYLFV